jgi:hypothetical protein
MNSERGLSRPACRDGRGGRARIKPPTTPAPNFAAPGGFGMGAEQQARGVHAGLSTAYWAKKACDDPRQRGDQTLPVLGRRDQCHARLPGIRQSFDPSSRLHWADMSANRRGIDTEIAGDSGYSNRSTSHNPSQYRVERLLTIYGRGLKDIACWPVIRLGTIWE